MRPKNGIRTAGNSYLTARAASLQMFAGIEHRMESVCRWNGIEFINDSKSTDVESSYFSLELLTSPVTWIVGASEIESDYSPFMKLLKYKVVNLIVFGKADDTALFENFSCVVDCYIKKENLKDAVDVAVSKSKSGYVVLFSPACSSFDEYEDYLERGNEFKSFINALK